MVVGDFLEIGEALRKPKPKEGKHVDKTIFIKKGTLDCGRVENYGLTSKSGGNSAMSVQAGHEGRHCVGSC